MRVNFPISQIIYCRCRGMRWIFSTNLVFTYTCFFFFKKIPYDKNKCYKIHCEYSKNKNIHGGSCIPSRHHPLSLTQDIPLRQPLARHHIFRFIVHFAFVFYQHSLGDLGYRVFKSLLNFVVKR